ncbi:uncharacterized protein BP5553_00512 [Venustampulla echinocandica]|uniref:F-box domain-containing protein n=1 Tax=Venustampulla echinocandica TaxID=2656787 RepID=A0A370TYE0_9HELO|nr:uncharacterized protein BP5553_00512 [Venustampulla echinocandica]RDL40533.1 hypothetical protein BP5553_00512 [Venustampulla echinocandica]
MDSTLSLVTPSRGVAAANPTSTRTCTQQLVQDISHDDAEIANVAAPARTADIMTKSRFSFLELPVELRLKIYLNILICPEALNIPRHRDSSSNNTFAYPSVGILQTCKLVNEEATPTLYSKNRLIITLPLEKGSPPNSGEPPASFGPSFHPSNFRWNTLTQMTSLSFTSGNNIGFSDPELPPSLIPSATFKCSGQELISRISPGSMVFSPQGPDKYMALSIANWVSLRVMTAELNAFHRELEAMMSSTPV